MKKVIIIQIALLGFISSCEQSNSQNTLRDAAKLDSLDRAYMVRDSITLDSIKKETFGQHEKRGGKIEYTTEHGEQQHRHIGFTDN